MRSKFEEQVAEGLDKAKVKYLYEPAKYYVETRGKRARTKCGNCGGVELVATLLYLPDFFIPRTQTYIEAKGRFTPGDRRKSLAFQAQYPQYKYRLLFQRDNTLSRVSKTRYSDWCKANDITYAIGTKVPEEWTK